jgi:hypothetical protein
MQFELVRCFKRFLSFLGADQLRIDGQCKEQEGLEWLESAA